VDVNGVDVSGVDMRGVDVRGVNVRDVYFLTRSAPTLNDTHLIHLDMSPTPPGTRNIKFNHYLTFDR